MNDLEKFDLESSENIKRMSKDERLRHASQEWINLSSPHRYVYNWRWMGLPIIQLPADIVVTQELIWKVRPTVIIETGVARGGSIIFNASQLVLLDLCENGVVSTGSTKRRCIGIDIDIRAHNRHAIETHPLSNMVELIEGSSIDQATLDHVKSLIKPNDRVMIILDSHHTHQHVITELLQYAPLVSEGSYLIVHDTGIEFAKTDAFQDREWGVGNNPLTALNEFLSKNSNFQIDDNVCSKLLITSSPNGYLERLADK